MTNQNRKYRHTGGHRMALGLILCLFGLCLVVGSQAARKKKAPRKKVDERVYLIHADRLSFDRYGRRPDAQVLNGHVSFRHKGATLTCDSAYFFEATNSFEAFGHVKLKQGDTLTLVSDYAYYDGNEQMARSRRNVILTHRGTKLYTDSLDYDRLYNLGYFFEGGKMVDNKNVLTSDWGEYDTETRDAVFNYDVKLKNPKFYLETDTLYYDVHTRLAHVTGPSTVTSGKSMVKTHDAYYDTNNDKARLFGRSVLVDEAKEITGDSLFRDEKNGTAEGFGNVIYRDKQNKNEMYSEYFWYDENQGYAYATDHAKLVDYSQKDTLYLHGDTLKMVSYNVNTDSVWRKLHCYYKVRMYRKDMQAVCDSLVYNSKDSVMTMYKDPIAWNVNRQLLGEVIDIFMKDSTIEHAHINGQALSIEKIDEKDHFNQVSSKDMFAYFINGDIHQSDAIGNVQTIFYPVDEKDSTFQGLNYLETDTMRMYLQERKLQRIKTNKASGTTYPMTQIPSNKYHLTQFAWFDYVRPTDKDDIFVWRGKKSGTELKKINRKEAPLQTLKPKMKEEEIEVEKEEAKEQTE
jgi:lipopolysaccharide export system protein LptA